MTPYYSDASVTIYHREAMVEALLHLEGQVAYWADDQGEGYVKINAALAKVMLAALRRDVLGTYRYSRENFADAMWAALNYARLADYGDVPASSAVPVSLLRLWADQFSEAANRAPTNAELVAEIEAGRGA